MALTVADRKDRLPHGGNKKIAEETGADMGYVSRAVAGEIFPKSKRTKLKLRRVMRAYGKQVGMPVEEVFSHDELARAEWPVVTSEERATRAS